MDTRLALTILGLEGRPSPAEIKKAYREQVRLWHPDRYSDGSPLKALAGKNIQDANLAYAFLVRQAPAASRRPSPRKAGAPMAPRSCDAPRARSQLLTVCTGLLASLKKTILRVDWRRLRHWLRRGAADRFRPWYRYPDRPTAGPDAPPASFDHALQKAIRNSKFNAER